MKGRHNAFVNYCNDVQNKIFVLYQHTYSDTEYKSISDSVIKHELQISFHGAVVVQSQATRDKTVNKFKMLCSYTTVKPTKMNYFL